MGLTLTGSMNISGKEELAAGMAFAAANKDEVVINGLSEQFALGGATTPAVTKQAAGELAMEAGAGEIDLRVLVGPGGAAVDGNGLKVQMAKFRNPEENANPITIEAADANGYDLLGAGWLITLNPGASAMFYLPEQPENIDATHKAIKVTGTLAQVLEYHIVMG